MNMQHFGAALLKALSELRQERDRIAKAIGQLESVIGVVRAPTARRGRKPGRPRKVGRPRGTKKVTKQRKKTTGWTAAKRKAVALRMKRYWAERRKAVAAS